MTNDVKGMTVGGSRALRAKLEAGSFVYAPSCADVFTARLAAQCGFEAVALGGYAMGAQTGITEPLLTMSEVVEQSRRIVAMTGLPLIVDAGAGFGDPLHTMRTVRELEQVGTAALHIEDQVFPKRAHYHRQYQERIVPAEEMVAKIAYAVEARTGDMVIIARTDAMQTDGYDEAIRRAELYRRAGADMIMIFPNDDREARAAPGDCALPLVYVNSTGNRASRPIYTTEQLSEMGYAMGIDAISTSIINYVATRELLTELRRTGIASLADDEAIAARLEIERLIGLEEHYAIEERTVEKMAV